MKKRILSMLLCILTMAGLCFTPAAAAKDASDITLRVGLLSQGTLPDPKLENVSGFSSGYAFGTMDGTTFRSEQSTQCTQLTMRVSEGAIQALDTVTGKVLYTAEQGADLAVQPNSEQTWFRGYKWYGSFVYRITAGNKLTVINYVGLEDYVKGVLPYEVDPNWPAEALKAQAVCARSFALGTHKHTSEGYDLCNTTNCQVYLGTNKATAASDAAVEATAGEYLMYNGEPVIGYFFSSDGGATEDAANVWGGDYAYLKGKVDPYEEKVDEWSVTLTAEEIRKKLTDVGYQIGTVANVAVTKRTATDNVNEVTVTDTDGKSVTISRSAVRTVFGLKSIRYTITPNGSAAPAAAAEPV
ncbi:MAG: SpoIID/LytB domain-containing protein, partial [Agathobaculum sp.]|uniref:SpoIID/LytB domain-containing protein n=1 Tax=Agathobaculum sp. TaxID=2048138 RepID=UPI003D8C6739